MSDKDLIRALRGMAVETGSLVCLGCGYEHSCGVHGCTIINEAVARLENIAKKAKLDRSLWGKESVVFPCKIGDLVYEVDKPEYGVITCQVLYINYYNGPHGHVPGNPVVSTFSIGVEVISGHGEGSSYCFEPEDIGELLFLSRQEAEDAIFACCRESEEGTT